MKLRDNVIAQFVVLVLAVTAGQLLLKMAVSYIPDGSFAHPLKTVVGSL